MIVNLIGIISAVLFLAAYWMVANRRVAATSGTYLGMMLGSALVAIVYLVVLEAWVSVAIQVFCAGISIQALWKVAR